MTRTPIRYATRRLQQRGVALITAIFVVALAVIAGVAMFEVSNLGAHRTANVVLTEAAWWYADGVESWVKSILQEDAKLSPDETGLTGIWAQPVPYLPIENGAIRGHIEDLQGRFNVNNLATTNVQQSAAYLAQFQRLIDSLPGFDASKNSGVGTAVREWVLSTTDTSDEGGGHDGDYLGDDPPYRAGAQPMSSISELLLVKGMTKELYAALKPYVAALPQIGTKINVNTASEPVLLSLAPDIDKSKLERFLVVRKAEPLKQTTDLFGAGETGFLPASTPVSGTNGVSASQFVAVTSAYFLLEAEVFVGSGRVALYSVFSRQQGGAPVVIAHSTDTE